MKSIVRSTLLALAVLGAASMRHAMAGAAPASVTTTGANVTTTVLPDQSTVVTFLSDGTITLGDDAVISRVLVVGGGGGGGGLGGGGGGAVVEVSQGFDGIEPGVPVSVTVGAGGAAAADAFGAAVNGEASSFGSITNAPGGGGGGGYSNAPKTGGANGGGGSPDGSNSMSDPSTVTSAKMQGASPVSSSGHKGGNATNHGSSSTGCGGGGGGGGAGADGGHSGVLYVSSNNDQTAESAGNGGAGLASDITGSLVYYGGGGGGGIRRSNFKYGGTGGAGGGGRGFGATPGSEGPSGNAVAMTSPQNATAGSDGLGGGGGGGGWDAMGSAKYKAGKGGSGVVIVRIAPVVAGPEPQLAIEGVTDGQESATVAVRLTDLGDGASSATVSYAVATSVAALDSATPVVAATGVLAGQRITFTIAGLAAGTTHYIRLFAENNLGETCQTEDAECHPYVSVVSATAVGAARVFDVGRDRVAVFSNSTAATTFTLAERGAVELLLVGGGGGGGSYNGGGGGAGGFLHLENAVLDAGTYTVTVGAGGAQATASSYPGGDGGDTTLARSGEAQNLYVAHGGGGGGGNDKTAQRAGRPGGSGGGAGNQSGTAGASTATGAECGNPGGANDSAHSSWGIGSGGGGAGAPGTHADYAGATGGAGGDGLPCSITGEEVWYAGGGGAGQNDQAQGGLLFTAGPGGRGGGGMGCRTADNVIDDYERGVDGLGGGGGGGRREGDNAVGKPRRGAPGGSGTLIVRWRATADATARATVDSVIGSVGGAIISGSVELAGADASSATLEMAVGPTGGSLGSYETLGTGLKAGERFTLTLGGLASGTAYDYAIRVTSGGTVGEILGAATGTFTTFTTAPATLSADPANATKTIVGTDTVYAFSTPGTYTFTVATPGRARVLMVGGGGAGGSSRGGGGGAGGFIENNAVQLFPGTYTVTVGAGGTVSSAAGYGGDGGDTVLRLAASGNVLFTAHGGGGGAYGSSELLTGRAGGSGGGGNACTASQSESTAVFPELGNPGGKGSGTTANTYNNAAAGGGGAGGPGVDAHSSDFASGVNRRQGGAGGAGVASDITGTTLWYAAGGGGGCWCDANGGYKGLGGSGVGGDGGGYTTEVAQTRTSPTAGADGTGSGGGGGFDYDKATDAARCGAAGGCGAFILRLAADDTAELPEVVIETLSAGTASLDASIALRSTGSSATADISLIYGQAADTLDLSASVASGAAQGLHTTTISGLAPGCTWYFAPVASISGGSVTGAVQSVTLPAAGAIPAGDASFGLWQIGRAASAAAFQDIFTNASIWAEAQSSNLVSGTLAANVTTILFDDPITGQSYAWTTPPRLFAYRGWIYLKGGRTVVFGSRFSDCAYVAVDGRTLINTFQSQKTYAFGSIQTGEAGWHEIDVRVGRTTGSVFGPDGDGIASWASFGVAFNDIGQTTPMPESAWTPIVDPGDGSLLRPYRPEARIISLSSISASGGTLTLSAKVGSGENAAHAYLLYGDEDFGTGASGASGIFGLGWTVSDIGEVSASATATNLACEVANWGSAATVARLVLDTEGMLAWTEPVTYTETALPQVSDVSVSDCALGDRATFHAAVSGGAEPYTATLLLGADSSSLSAAATLQVAEASAFAIPLADIAPGEQHFFQIVVTDDSGATARSEVLSFVTPGASRVFDATDNSSKTVWESVNPFEKRQRTIVFGGTVSEYGAGETTVRLLRNQGYYGCPGAKTTEPHEGEELVVPAAGAYSLSRSFDWDLDLTWNWSVSNSNGTVSWGPTSAPRDVSGWARNTTIIDATTYTWSGGSGLWTDSASWTSDGVWDDIAGYPRRGSYAVFPAGTSVVSVPDTATTNRFSQLTIPANATVEFRPAEGATDATLRMQEETAVSSARGYGFSQSANSTLRFAGRELFVALCGNWTWYPTDSDTTLDFTDGVRADLGGNATGSSGSWSGNGKARSVLSVRNGAKVTVRGYLRVSGSSTQMVLDNAMVSQPYGNSDNNGIWLSARDTNGKATLVIRGTNALFKVGQRFQNKATDTADITQYVDFEVPEGGWQTAPIYTDPANTYKFGQGSANGYKIALRIPATSPAVVAGESLDVPLVRWPGGIQDSAVTLAPANLPHPATDSFFQTTDPVTGQITVWAHLVGQTDTGAPQASDFRVRSLSQTGADLSFVVIPGSGGATAVSAEVLDANGDAVPGATVSPASATFSVSGTNLVTVAGLESATAYTLRVTLDDGVNAAVTSDFAFNSLDDWAAGESAMANSVVTDGPYTVWTFTDTTPHAATFTVTRAGLAEILVVGGGGAGGAGYSGSTYGGGGGGGGQVLATSVVLVPGIYPISVGKGGARGTSRAVGADGAVSAFGDIVVIGGGGGGYNSVGRPGASGGGGSNNKNGGAGSAGFAGGKGASNLAGGGGGGAGGAGTDGASTFGGAGGAGLESAITGVPLVYGAGGGGGSSGSYTAYKSGGEPGAPTAGRGSEASYDGRKAASAGAQDAAAGFGGGGGGGCASSSGSDNPGYYGGAGGSGTVIIRMRTATASVPAPQIVLASDEAGEAGWTAALKVFSLGQGASEVEATLRAARDGASVTNDFPMGAITATGATNLVAVGLAPSSDYDGLLVLDNGLEGGTLEIPVSFTTSDPVATTFAAGTAWTFGQWTSVAADFHATSLIRTALPVATIASTGAAATETYPARTTDGKDDASYSLPADRCLSWTWTDPVYLTAFRAFYNNGDWRAALNIASVEVLGADGTWVAISPSAAHYYDQWGRNYGYLLPVAGATALWSQPAYGIRFTSDGNVSSDSHYLREVEVEGVSLDDLPADISITSLTRTAAGIKTLVTFSHALQADATVTAYVGASHGGTDASRWTAVATADMEAGALAQNFSIGAATLDGMNYLRFSYLDENDVERWTETVFLPDVEVLADIPPVVHFVAQRAATPGTAALAVSLLDAGTGAENDSADIYIRYASISNEVASASEQSFETGASEGESVATITGLMPDRSYWAQFVARNAGGDSGVSEIFQFATEPDEFGDCHVLTVEAASWSGGTLSATVSRPVTNAVGTIHAVSGVTYHGTNAVEWTTEGGDAVFGALAENQASASGTFTPAAGAVYVRFYETDGEGTVVGWSDTIPAVPGALRVVDGGVEADGDTAVFPIRVISAGTGTLSVRVLLADEPDFTNATVIAVANPGVGSFVVTNAVEPGGTYWYRVVAETTGGGLDETQVASFTTLTGSVLALGVSQGSVTHRTVTLNGTLTTLGAGVTTLEILAGDSADALAVFDTITLDQAGAFSITETFTGLPRTIYYRFHTVNVAPGGTRWESWSNTGNFTTIDNVKYTWKKTVTEGAWDDPANWTPDKYADNCTGYPNHPNAGVVFENGTVARVSVPGNYTFSTWSIAINDVDLTFTGQGVGASSLTGNMTGGKMLNSKWTFAALTVTESNGVEFGSKSNVNDGRNSTMTLTDGAVFRTKEYGFTLFGTNQWLVIEKGSSLQATNTDKKGYVLDSTVDGGFRLDNGTINTVYFRTHGTFPQTRGQSLWFSGNAPRITLSDHFRNADTTAANAQNDDTKFLFSIPASGWKNPVIYSENEGEMFAGLLGDGAGKYAIGIDPKSPIFKTGGKRTVTLVAWKGGVDTNHVVFAAPPKGTEVFYTFGWPSVLNEPENVGDLPTGVWAEVSGAGGFKFIVR